MGNASAVTVYAYDALTGRFLTRLPFQGVQFSSQLNGTGSFSGTLAATDPRVRAIDPWDATTPGKTVLVVDYRGQPVEAYLVLSRKRQRSKGTIDVQGPSLWAYFQLREQATDYSSPPASPMADPMAYWSQQPFDAALIAAQVVSDALLTYAFGTASSATDILGGLTVLVNGAPPKGNSPVVPSQYWVAPSYPYSSLQSVDAIVSQLAALGWLTGIDYGLDVEYSDGPESDLLGIVNISYPRRGVVASESGLVVQTRQARDYEFDEDASQQGVVIYETGAVGAMDITVNPNPLTQGWPLLEQVSSQSSVSGPNAPAILAAIGASDSYLQSFPPVTGSVTVPLFGSDPAFGTYRAGDDCTVLGAPDELFPAGFSDEWRIVSYEADLRDEGDETVTLTLNTPPAASATAPAV